MDKFVGIVKTNHCTLFLIFLVDWNICNHNFVENVFVKIKKKLSIFSEDPVKLAPVNCSKTTTQLTIRTLSSLEM